jgi:hypothetical protein
VIRSNFTHVRISVIIDTREVARANDVFPGFQSLGFAQFRRISEFESGLGCPQIFSSQEFPRERYSE